MQVASAFSQLLNLHNLTEEIITARVEKAQRIGEVGVGWQPIAGWPEHSAGNSAVGPVGMCDPGKRG